MKRIARSAIVEHSAARCTRWSRTSRPIRASCRGARRPQVQERTRGHDRAPRSRVGMRGLRQSFTTRNQNRPGEAIDLRLVEGPFRRFAAAWRFSRSAPQACRIEFSLQYEFSSRTLARLLEPLFDHIADTHGRRVRAPRRRALWPRLGRGGLRAARRGDACRVRLARGATVRDALSRGLLERSGTCRAQDRLFGKRVEPDQRARATATGSRSTGRSRSIPRKRAGGGRCAER